MTRGSGVAGGRRGRRTVRIAATTATVALALGASMGPASAGVARLPGAMLTDSQVAAAVGVPAGAAVTMEQCANRTGMPAGPTPVMTCTHSYTYIVPGSTSRSVSVKVAAYPSSGTARAALAAQVTPAAIRAEQKRLHAVITVVKATRTEVQERVAYSTGLKSVEVLRAFGNTVIAVGQSDQTDFASTTKVVVAQALALKAKGALN